MTHQYNIPIALSLIVATRNRGFALGRMFRSFLGQPGVERCEIIIIDNGSCDDTQDVIKEFSLKLPLISLSEPVAGKSRALNRGLDIARSELIAFTDDDVCVSAVWISELIRGAVFFPDAAGFCGPIIPLFPTGTPEWLKNHDFADAAFGHFDPDLPEGVLRNGLVPYGPNFAVRKAAIGTERFRVDLGPSTEGPFMCEDIEFAGRIIRLCSHFIFLPRASVQHVIREQLTAFDSLYERAFYMGRSIIRAHHREHILPISFAGPSEALHFGRAALYNYYLGQLAESCGEIRIKPSRVVSALGALGAASELPLSSSASEFLARHGLSPLC